MSHHNTVTKSCPTQNNKAVFAALVAHGFSLPAVRKAMIQLNGIPMRELAGEDLSITTVSNTLKGKRFNARVARDVSRRLGLDPAALFPERDEGEGDVRRR